MSVYTGIGDQSPMHDFHIYVAAEREESERKDKLREDGGFSLKLEDLRSANVVFSPKQEFDLVSAIGVEWEFSIEECNGNLLAGLEFSFEQMERAGIRITGKQLERIEDSAIERAMGVAV